MLDTSIISDLIRNPQGRAAKRIAKVGEGNVCTSVIVAAELRYGCAKSGSERLLETVEDLPGAITVLPSMSPRCGDTPKSDPRWKRPESRSAATTS
jgi:tRNA(fMet)-specific endonuclease VapC